MKPPPDHAESDARRAHAAANWVLRCDRGLTPAEQDELSSWLAADPRHGEQLALHRIHWQRLDTLALWQPNHAGMPNPDLLAPPVRTRLPAFAPYLALAAAAVLAVLLFRSFGGAVDGTPALAQAAAVDSASSRTLPDGTRVELNRHAEVSVAFSPAERRVQLVRGEAHFAVTKDATRPFIVQAGGVEVRAVGTAFNVRLAAATLEVLVTEGKVAVDRSQAQEPAETTPAAVPTSTVSELSARQRAVVVLAPEAPPPEIATLTTGEIARVLAWQHRVVDFTAMPLRDVVAEFNRRNVVQLVIADPELGAVKISATFRTSNIDGFVHLLETGFGAVADRSGAEEIVLHRARR